MRTRYTYYRGKDVLPDDMADLFDAIEESIDGGWSKRGITGYLTGLPTVTAGTIFDLDVASGGADPFSGHDSLGQIILFETDPVNTGDLSGEFTLPTAGNEKWLTLVVRYIKADSQPEVEKVPPVFTTVQFRQTQSYEFVIIEGTQALIGTATKPDITAEEGLYLADILVTFGDTDFTAAMIETDPVRPLSSLRVDALREVVGRGLDGISERLALLSEVVVGPGSRPGDAISVLFAGSPLGDLTPIVLPAGTNFVHLHIGMGGGAVPGGGGHGHFVLDVANNRLDGGAQTQTAGGLALVGFDPNVPGAVLCSTVAVAGGPVSLATKSFVAGVLTLQTIGSPSTTTSGQITVIFFR